MFLPSFLQLNQWSQFFFNLIELFTTVILKLYLVWYFWMLSCICLYVAYSAWLFRISEAFVAFFGYGLTVALCPLHEFFLLLQVTIPRRFSQNYGAVHCHSKKKLFIFYSSLYIQILTQYDNSILGQNMPSPLRVSFQGDVKHSYATLAQKK